jgi:hypothetical protein
MKTLNHALVAFIAALTVISVNHAQAADDMPSAAGPTYEVTGGSTASYSHTTSAGQGSHSWNLATGVGYFFNNMYELGGTVAFNSLSGNGNTTKKFAITVGPTFNFFGTPENAFFVTLQAGVQLTGLGSTTDGNGNTINLPNFTQFAYLAGIGKRIEIVKHVTWTPEVTLTGVLKNTDQASGSVDPSSTSFNIIPFQFSVLF